MNPADESMAKYKVPLAYAKLNRPEDFAAVMALNHRLLKATSRAVCFGIVAAIQCALMGIHVIASDTLTGLFFPGFLACVPLAMLLVCGWEAHDIHAQLRGKLESLRAAHLKAVFQP